MKARLLALALLVACGDEPPPRPRAAIAIIATYPGASSEVIEANVVQPLEAAVSQVEGVTSVVTKIDGERARILLEVARGREPYAMSSAVQARVNEVRRVLPQDAPPPMIQTISLAPPAMWLVIDSDRPRLESSEIVDEVIVRTLERLAGVGEIERHGLVETAVVVRPDPERLQAYGLTPGELVRVLNAQDVNLPGGRIDGTLAAIRATGNVNSLEELTGLVVTQTGAQTVRLRDVAAVHVDIEREPAEGELRLVIKAQAGASRREVRERVRAALPELALPPGVHVREVPAPAAQDKVLVGSIRGPHRDEVVRLSKVVVGELVAAGVKDVVRDPPLGEPTLRVDVDRSRAADLGISMADVMAAIEIATSGASAGELTDGARTLPIVVRLPTPSKSAPAFEHLYVRGKRGDVVSVGMLVSWAYEEGSVLLLRDREPAIDLVAPAASAEKVRAHLERRAGNWPVGYRAVIAR